MNAYEILARVCQEHLPAVAALAGVDVDDILRARRDHDPAGLPEGWTRLQDDVCGPRIKGPDGERIEWDTMGGEIFVRFADADCGIIDADAMAAFLGVPRQKVIDEAADLRRILVSILRRLGWHGEPTDDEVASGDEIAGGLLDEQWFERWSAYESDGLRLETDTHPVQALHAIALRLGHRGPLTVSDLVDSVPGTVDAHREAAVALNVVDHILARKDGPVPIEPWPVGVSTDPVINRADMAVQGLNAAASALGKITAATTAKPVVRRVAIYGTNDSASRRNSMFIETELLAAGVQEVLVITTSCEYQARIDAQTRLVAAGGGAVLGVVDRDTVRVDGRTVPLTEWLASVEVRS